MQVIFGSSIEVIIDPRMDPGEAIRAVLAPDVQSPGLDSSAAPHLPALREPVCSSVAALATKNKASQVGSGFLNKADKRQKTSACLGVWKTSSLSPALIFVPSGGACAVGSLFAG